MYSGVPIRQNTLHSVFERFSKETNAFFHRILQSLAFVDVDLTEEEEKCIYQIKLTYKAIV